MSDILITSKQKLQEESTLLKQVRFIKALTADPDLEPSGKIVANALIFTFWNKDEGKARPGHARLAKEAGTTNSSAKRGIDSLKARGWFIVEPSFDDQGDPGPNHYYPVWKRAEGKAPAGSERPKKAQRKPPEPITFEAGNVRLTASEYAEIEKEVGILAFPLFDDLKRNPPNWSEKTWRNHLAVRVELYAEQEEEIGEPAAEPVVDEELVF